jgi:ElaB/YqjD/DUF883 family membrane-anchored ribosome-binding protein
MSKGFNSEAITEEMREIVRHSQALLEATAGEVDDKVQKIRSDLEERLRSAKGNYGELEDCLKDKFKCADEFVRDKPYHAIGGTFLAGLILGWLATRK